MSVLPFHSSRSRAAAIAESNASESWPADLKPIACLSYGDSADRRFVQRLLLPKRNRRASTVARPRMVHPQYREAVRCPVVVPGNVRLSPRVRLRPEGRARARSRLSERVENAHAGSKMTPTRRPCMKDSAIRIGAVNYLNTKPLIEDLETLAPEAELILEVPSRLADLLAEGQLDVALIPVIEYFRAGNYTIVPNISIASRGPVLSVTLFSRVPWKDIRRVALDEGSRTSAALCQVLLRKRHGVHPEFVPLPLD